VHLNDSKVPFDSKKDRHENLGDGEIGQDAMTKILNHPKLKKLDFVMETPALKSMDTAQGEVDKLKSWAK
jgi:deoxyribonuclease-4